MQLTDNKSPEPVGPGLKSTRQVSRRGRFVEQSRVAGCSQSRSIGGEDLVVHGWDYTITSVIARTTVGRTWQSPGSLVCSTARGLLRGDYTEPARVLAMTTYNL